MTICEVSALGFGWLDLGAALYAAFLLGGMLAWRIRDRTERDTVLAAIELTRRGKL